MLQPCSQNLNSQTVLDRRYLPENRIIIAWFPVIKAKTLTKDTGDEVNALTKTVIAAALMDQCWHVSQPRCIFGGVATEVTLLPSLLVLTSPPLFPRRRRYCCAPSDGSTRTGLASLGSRARRWGGKLKGGWWRTSFSQAQRTKEPGSPST